MSRAGRVVLMAGLALGGLRAQTYSLTEVVSMAGPGQIRTVYRNGPKVVVEGPQTTTLYDLQALVSYAWNPGNPGAGCSSVNFFGDWGDPFGLSAMVADRIAKQQAKETGTETINGTPARIVETPDTPGVTVRLWQDPKLTLVIRGQNVPASGPARTLFEVRKFSADAPDPSLFSLPAGCQAPAKTVGPPQAYIITTDVTPPGGSKHRATTYRNGSRAVLQGEQGSRSLNDLQAHTRYIWNPGNPGAGCSSANLTGDWGDPFALSAMLEDQIAKKGAKVTGVETINGIAARVVESTEPGGITKLWQDPKSSLVLRAQSFPPGGPAVTLLEVQSFRMTAPDPSLFVLPPGCQAPAKPPEPPQVYTITRLNTPSGGPAHKVTIYRDGSRALVDTGEIRTLDNLQAHTNYTWSVSRPGICSLGNYFGDWGDPFLLSPLIEDQLAKGRAKETGSDTINGIATRTVESPNPPHGSVRFWQDPKSTLVVRAQTVPAAGPAVTEFEVKTFSTVAPDPSVFVLPAGCGAPAKPAP